MGYTALLFCPEEKTARTVTQVLSELEFGVESCLEPFQAVKKLMSQHFDAVVVDCDNEQNATLIFKSSRNSTQNQASLAVAVVEGQAGVAKAFRIGANLVLTKPINIEQAKGTLRVARGLLRKAEPAKPAAGSVPATPATAAAPASPFKPVAAPKPEAPPAAEKISQPESQPAPAAEIAAPAPWPTQAAAASSSPVVHDDDVLEIASPSSPSNSGITTLFGSGAASAPAPAREVAPPGAGKATPASDADDILERPSDALSTSVAAAPSFTLGGFEDSGESTGGVKKILFAVAAVAIVLVALYAAWAHFHGHSSGENSEPTPASAATEPVAAAPAKATPVAPAIKPPAAVTPLSKPTSDAAPAKSVKQEATDSSADDDSSATSKSAEEPAAAPLIVKGGKAPAHKKTAADAPPPTIEGLDASTAGAALPDLGASDATAPKPVLGTLNVSQGVSRGLLIKKVQPVYPRGALAAHVEGTVELQATISKSGEISKVKVLSGDDQLTKAAADAVKQWKYKPYLLNGEPVEINTQVTINFKLPN